MQKWAHICCRCSTTEIQSYWLIDTELLLPASPHFNLWNSFQKAYNSMVLSFIKLTSFYYHDLGLATFQGPYSIKEIHAYRTSIFSSCQKSNLLHHWSPILDVVFKYFLPIRQRTPHCNHDMLGLMSHEMPSLHTLQDSFQTNIRIHLCYNNCTIYLKDILSPKYIAWPISTGGLTWSLPQK